MLFFYKCENVLIILGTYAQKIVPGGFSVCGEEQRQKGRDHCPHPQR